MKNKTLIILTGPTAVGKTRLAIDIAKQYGAEIISADSRQFYKEMKIGTAAPTEEELAEVKHHLVGHLSMHDYYNVSIFEKDALTILDKAFETKDIMILTGGSTMYIDVIFNGIDDLPDADPKLRESLKNEFEEKSLEWRQKEVEKHDPEYHAIADLANHKRLLRALEVCIGTGKTYTSQRVNKKIERDFNIIKLGLNREREELFERINRRVDIMIKDGLEEEVESLLSYRDLNALNTVGYKELFKYFDDEFTLDEAIEKIKTNSRRYAKRQLTWFKRDTEWSWFSPEDTSEIFSFLDKSIKDFQL